MKPGRAALLVTLAAGAVPGVAAQAAAQAPHRVYVSNEHDGTVSVIDPAAGRVIATIRVGHGPRGIHVAPDGTVLVALSDTMRRSESDRDRIVVVDPRTGRIVAAHRA